MDRKPRRWITLPVAPAVGWGLGFFLWPAPLAPTPEEIAREAAIEVLIETLQAPGSVDRDDVVGGGADGGGSSIG